MRLIIYIKLRTITSLFYLIYTFMPMIVLRKGIKLQGEVNGKTVWTKGFDEIFKENELQRMLADYGISQKEYQEQW